MTVCKAPTWCGTGGPGMDAVVGVDYVRGWYIELYCSTACRDVKCPRMAGQRGLDMDESLVRYRAHRLSSSVHEIFADGCAHGRADLEARCQQARADALREAAGIVERDVSNSHIAHHLVEAFESLAASPTQPAPPGRCAYCGHPKNSGPCQASHP